MRSSSPFCLRNASPFSHRGASSLMRSYEECLPSAIWPMGMCEDKTHRVIGHAPLAVMIHTLTTWYLYEVAVDDNTTPFITEHHVDKVLVHRNGGRGLVTSVSRDNLADHVMGLIKMRLYPPYDLMKFTSDMFIQSNIDVTFLNQTSGETVLALETGTWSHSDVYKTAVFPGNTPILLTRYINASHFAGIKPFSFTVEDFSAESGKWILIDFGYDTLNNESVWHLEEDVCQVEIAPDPHLEGKTMIELDLGEYLHVTYLATTQDKERQGAVQVFATLSNPWVFRVQSTVTKWQHPHHDNLTLSLSPRISRKGVAAVRIGIRQPSLTCALPVYVLTVHAGCPCTKRLTYWYPETVPMHVFLYGNPVDSVYGKPILIEIVPNYRPPSALGFNIPLSDNIYNADPSLPRPNDRFKRSRESGVYKQCAGKANRSECACTEEMLFTSDVAYSDCKQRVYRMSYPGYLELNFTIEERGKASQNVSENHVIVLKELNNRTLLIKVNDEAKDNGFEPSTLQTVLSTEYSHLFEHQIWDPRNLTISMNGSGLYHIRAEMIPGISFCNLYAEFQVYIDKTPIAYPMMFVVNFTMAFVLGGVFFVIYLYYLSNHHHTRVRQLGDKCMDLHQVQRMEGIYSPSKYPPTEGPATLEQPVDEAD